MNEGVMHQKDDGDVLRRSPRAMVKIPVVIKGKNKHGEEFKEVTETRVVSRFGARICSSQELKQDTILKLRRKKGGEWADFRVAWIGSKGNNMLGDVGIEFIRATNFFGVAFPDED